MNKLLLLLCFLLALTTQAQTQVQQKAIKPLIEQRLYQCFEVEYNAIHQAQRLYKARRFDTLDALITFWSSHCPLNERLFSLSILNSIRSNTFQERISSDAFLKPRIRPVDIDSDVYRPSVLYMLREYSRASRGAYSSKQHRAWDKENYALPATQEDYNELYHDYYAFLRHMATDLAGKRTYSPIEDFFLRFYADPEHVRYSELDSAYYTGTVLHDVYKDYARYDRAVHGLSYGLQAGAWIPTDKLTLLGNHPYVGVHFGGKAYKTAWDCVMGARFNRSPNDYNVLQYDSLYTTHFFTSWYFGLDITHTLWHRGKHQLDLLWGIGYEGIQTLNLYDNTRKPATTTTHYVGTGYLNPGLGYKFYVRNRVINDVRRTSYLALQGRYYITDLTNKGGTDIHGNYYTIGLVYGGYWHGYTKYPYLK